MEIPELPLFTSGPLTSGKLNRIRDVVAIWQNPPAAMARASASQSITSGGAYQLVTFHTTEYDTDTVVTSTSRFTVKTSGRYLVAATVTFSANVSGSRYVTVRKNAAGSPTGGTVLASGTASPVSGASTTVSLPANLRVALSANDTLEVFVYQDSGSSLTLNSSPGDTFMIVELSAVTSTLSGTEAANLPSLHAQTALGTADLDSVKAPGNYLQSSNSDATLARHYPEASVAGHLKVYSDGATLPDLVEQVFTTYLTSGFKVWRRNYVTAGGWGAWTESTGSTSGNSGVLTWDGSTYQPTSLHTSSAAREFRGPTDPSVVSGITVNHYDVWVEMAAPAASAPAQVTGLGATAGPGQVSLSWTAPSNGGSAITDYRVDYRIGTGSWSTFTDGVSTSTSAVVTGLTDGTTYGFRVAAINAVGTGTASAEVTATPGNAYRSLLSSLSPVILINDATTAAGVTWPTDATGNSTPGQLDSSVFDPNGGATSLGDTGFASQFVASAPQGYSLGQPSVLNSLTAFSMVALVNVSSLAADRALVCRDDAGPGNWALRDYQWMISSAGAVQFVHIGGALANVKTISGGTLSTGTTYLLAVTSSGTSAKVYVNGTQVATDTHSARTSPAVPTSVGVLWNSTSSSERRYMDGTIDGLAIFNTELTPTQIANLATAAGV